MNISYYYRKPGAGNFSLERVFESVRKNLPKEIEQKTFIPKYVSRGIFSRVYDIVEASFHQGDINHITGDVHFLSYLLHKTKTVLTIHDCVFLNSKLSKLSKAIIKFFWYTIPARRVACITTVSEFSKNQILSVINFDEKKIFVIPVPLIDGFKHFKRTFNLKEPTVLQIGTAENKNLFNLFKALEGIRCRLNIVGHLNAKHRAALKKHKIKFKNFTNLSDEQIIEQYQNCDLVSFVSTYEGFGMPIVEANAVGRAVITSNLKPMKDVAGNAACLVDPNDTSSIKAGIIKIIGDVKYREKLIAAGLENAKRYDGKTIAKQYLEVYKKIAN